MSLPQTCRQALQAQKVHGTSYASISFFEWIHKLHTAVEQSKMKSSCTKSARFVDQHPQPKGVNDATVNVPPASVRSAVSPALANVAVAPSTSMDLTVPTSLEGITLTGVPTLTAPPSSLPPTEMPPLCPLKTSVMGILKGLLVARSEGLKALMASTTEGPCIMDPVDTCSRCQSMKASWVMTVGVTGQLLTTCKAALLV